MSKISHRATIFCNSNKTTRQIIAATFIGLAVLSSMWLTFSGAAGQEQKEKRLIEKRLDFFPPVKITTVKTKKGVIKLEEEFLDDDDWLKGLTVKLANASGKSVTYIDVEMTFPRPANQAERLPAGWHLYYGLSPFWFKPEEAIPPPKVKPILPGDTIELTLHDRSYDDLKAFLKDRKFPASIKKLELRVIGIGFSDGTVWHGRMLRRDPKAPGGWSPIEEPKTENSHGSARNRTAELFKINLKNFGDGETWPFLKAIWITPRLLQTECGKAIQATISCGVQAGYDCRYNKDELYSNPNPTESLVFWEEPCTTNVNGVLVNCGSSQLSSKRVPCPVPPLGLGGISCGNIYARSKCLQQGGE